MIVLHYRYTKLNGNLNTIATLNISNLSDASGIVTLHKKCGIITAQISLTLNVELAQYGYICVANIPDASFFPNLQQIGAAIWTNKYLQPFHAGYVSVDTNGSIVIRTSEAISVNDRLNANLTWTVH